MLLYLIPVGVTIAELVLSELLLYSIVGIVQVIVIMTIVYAAFDVSHAPHNYTASCKAMHSC